MPHPDDQPELPPELLALAEQLLAASPPDRDALLDRLAREHPAHAAALSGVAADLFGIDRLLTAGYRAPGQPDPIAIGGRRVVRRLGEGAFGAVYLCAQSSPVRRDVAVKVLRPGAGDRGTLARFAAERQFLARQSHPAITQVFDAGEMPDGRPYFVMEHVPGSPITEYCDRRRLPIRARVELFTRLCHGVAHAHAHGIVHRDLKPANILVIDVDGGPQPKIIDFGVAKALAPEADTAPATPFATETGRVVGTPGYMSPEQAQGRREAIDARSDVFALGVILYELLTGELPWGRRPTTTDDEAVQPSRRVTADPTRTTTVAELRACDPRRLVSSLRGDLDWIVLKALQGDRGARYASAREFAADLQRHLGHQTVHAGPPALAYRAGKALRRHRVAASVVALGVVAVVVALLLQRHYQGMLLEREQDANAAVAALLARANDVAVVHTPNSAPLRQGLMQDALTFYDRFLGDRPGDDATREARARTLTSLSQVHWLLGQYPQAVATARDAVADGEQLLTRAPESCRYRGVLGAAVRNLGRALSSSGQREQGRAQMARAVELLEACHAEVPAAWVGLLTNAMVELTSMMAPATEGAAQMAMLKRARELQEGMLAANPNDDDRRTLITTNLGLLQRAIGSGDAAVAMDAQRRMEDLLAGLTVPDPSHALRVHHAAAEMAQLQGDAERATGHLQAAIVAGEQVCAQDTTRPQPLEELTALHAALAQQQYSLGQMDAGHAAMRAAIAVASRRVARFPDDALAQGTLASRSSYLAYALMAAGKRSQLAEAEAQARHAASLLSALPASVDSAAKLWLRWINGYRLARILVAAGKPDTEGIWLRAGEDLAAWRNQRQIDASQAADIVEAAVWLAGRHEVAGAPDAVEAWLGVAEAMLREFSGLGRHPLRQAQVLRLRAQQAASRGELDAAAAFAEQAAGAGADWQGLVAAADGMWAAATQADAASDEHAEFAQRADELWHDAVNVLAGLVRQAPDDPWVVLPLAHCRIHLARGHLLADRRDEARRLLTLALEGLAPWREQAFADEWDPRLVDEARGMLAGL